MSSGPFASVIFAVVSCVQWCNLPTHTGGREWNTLRLSPKQHWVSSEQGELDSPALQLPTFSFFLLRFGETCHRMTAWQTWVCCVQSTDVMLHHLWELTLTNRISHCYSEQPACTKLPCAHSNWRAKSSFSFACWINSPASCILMKLQAKIKVKVQNCSQGIWARSWQNPDKRWRLSEWKMEAARRGWCFPGW